MSEPSPVSTKTGLRRILSGVLTVLGLVATYWAFQPDGPDSFGRYEAFGDLLMDWKVGPVSPLMLLLGGFLVFEAYRMAFSKGRYRSRD